MEESFVSEESISASPDFAQVYIFIQTFGSLLKLPPVTLSGLEDFFLQGKAIPMKESIAIELERVEREEFGRDCLFQIKTTYYLL